MQDDKHLSDLQMDIMRVLWQSGEASVSTVHEALQKSRELAPTTVATLLSRLEKRGLITHRSEGRQYIYRATTSEGEIKRSMVGDLIKRLFHGDSSALVSHLVKSSRISADDLDTIKTLIQSAEKQQEAGDE